MKVRSIRHIRLFLQGDRSGYQEQGIQESIRLIAHVDLGAESLDEPGAGIAATEGVMVPEGRLENEKIRKIWDFVRGSRVLAGMTSSYSASGVGFLYEEKFKKFI